MTGCRFSAQQYKEFLFEVILEKDINSWLWFHLKLASFEFKQNQASSKDLIDIRTQYFPNNYHAYFLEDLVQDVTQPEFLGLIWNKKVDDETNVVLYAKILFYVGEFKESIQKLLEVGRVLEATVIGTVMHELSLMTTKQSIYETVRSKENEAKLSHFTEEELTSFYSNSFDLDGHLLLLAFRQCKQNEYLTQAFTLIYMVQVESLKLTAMSHLIRTRELEDMLLENEVKYVLEFEINKDISLK